MGALATLKVFEGLALPSDLRILSALKVLNVLEFEIERHDILDGFISLVLVSLFKYK